MWVITWEFIPHVFLMHPIFPRQGTMGASQQEPQQTQILCSSPPLHWKKECPTQQKISLCHTNIKGITKCHLEHTHIQQLSQMSRTSRETARSHLSQPVVFHKYKQVANLPSTTLLKQAVFQFLWHDAPEVLSVELWLQSQPHTNSRCPKFPVRLLFARVNESWLS